MNSSFLLEESIDCDVSKKSIGIAEIARIASRNSTAFAYYSERRRAVPSNSESAADLLFCAASTLRCLMMLNVLVRAAEMKAISSKYYFCYAAQTKGPFWIGCWQGPNRHRVPH